MNVNRSLGKVLAASLLSAGLFMCLPTAASAKKVETFEVGNKTFLLNGKPFIVKAAEVHYPRIPRPYWEQRIKMCKALGMNTLCLYVFWNIHEQEEGKFDFTGNNDVAEFIRLAQKNGMYVIVRPGPYVCAEWEMGGLPWWLLKKKDIRLREQDPYFMERYRIFAHKLAEQIGDLLRLHDFCRLSTGLYYVCRICLYRADFHASGYYSLCFVRRIVAVDFLSVIYRLLFYHRHCSCNSFDSGKVG